jgi:acetylornithine/succinyldiaminopimelate/putrescine aminotransferase/predicted amino acid dehydrogenase
MLAETVRTGHIVVLRKTHQEVVDAQLQDDGTSAGKYVSIRLRNLHTGAITQERFASNARFEQAPVMTLQQLEAIRQNTLSNSALDLAADMNPKPIAKVLISPENAEERTEKAECRSDAAENAQCYQQYARPQIGYLLNLLKLDRSYVRASGDSLFYRDAAGRETRVVDFIGGYGSTILGHNPPETTQALRELIENQAPVHAQASIRTEAGALARQISDLLIQATGKPETYITTLCNSGTEAVEAALKHALMAWEEKKRIALNRLEQYRAKHVCRSSDASQIEALEALIQQVESTQPSIVALEGSFHGKTAGSVAVTSNIEYRRMYSSAPLKVCFIASDANAEQFDALLASEEIRVAPNEKTITSGFTWSNVAGIIIEPIQGEGGVRPLSKEFGGMIGHAARAREIPLIVDEIQTGVYRTGEFLASTALGIYPDYVLLGKSLGGSVCKIAALAVRSSHYMERFGFCHTSTFAEDDWSSKIARTTLETLSGQSESIRLKAAQFEARVREGVARIQAMSPGSIQEVRGRGFLLGIQFNFDLETVPGIMNVIYQAGFAAYLYSSYLLHNHNVRVGVTLSRPDTIRIQPCAHISAQNVTRLLNAIEDLCTKIRDKKLIALTAHIWKQDFTSAEINKSSPLSVQPPRAPASSRKVGFLSHVISDAVLKTYDPLLDTLNPEQRERFLTEFGPMSAPALYLNQEIRGANGTSINLHCYGVKRASNFFERSLRRASGQGLAVVQEMAKRARADGIEYLGLGQYTSIVSDNGLLLRRSGVPVTTGNSLTAGYAAEAFLRAIRRKGKDPSQIRIGVMGAAGNICNVIVQLLAERCGEMTLLFREDPSKSPKAQHAIASILDACPGKKDHLRISADSTLLTECDAIIAGTNSATHTIFPHSLKRDAVVLDLSVPSNIHPSVLTERPDVSCFHGGLAKLPDGQKLVTPYIPVPTGEVFACMGETITLGLLGRSEPYSVGPLTRAGVLQIMDLAAEAGLSLGSLRELTPEC